MMDHVEPCTIQSTGHTQDKLEVAGSTENSAFHEVDRGADHGDVKHLHLRLIIKFLNFETQLA